MTDIGITVGQTVEQIVAGVLAKVTAQLGASKAAALTPVIQKYGPALAGMTATELWAWLDLALKGNASAAYAAVLAKMSSDDLNNEWTVIGGKWDKANAVNAAAVQYQAEALSAFLSALIAVARALLGL